MNESMKAKLEAQQAARLEAAAPAIATGERLLALEEEQREVRKQHVKNLNAAVKAGWSMAELKGADIPVVESAPRGGAPRGHKPGPKPGSKRPKQEAAEADTGRPVGAPDEG